VERSLSFSCPLRPIGPIASQRTVKSQSSSSSSSRLLALLAGPEQRALEEAAEAQARAGRAKQELKARCSLAYMHISSPSPCFSLSRAVSLSCEGAALSRELIILIRRAP
jgi:hypothetical protein